MTQSAADDVLILLPALDTGGVARVACLLANGFAGDGLAVGLATIGRGDGPARSLLEPAVKIRPAPLLGRRPRRLLARLWAAPSLVLRLRRTRPAVFLSPGNHVHLLAALVHWASGGQSRLVLKLTNPIHKAHHGPLRRGLRALVFRWMLDRADQILALSPEAAAEAARVAPSAAARVRVVANPYVPDSAIVHVGAGPSPADVPFVLAVGRLTRQKNFALLLEAMALHARPWRLAVLGAGKERVRLVRLAERLGVAARVAFVGHTADPTPYYRQAALLAVTSRWEGLPAVAIEALAAGCPVVTTDCSPALSRLILASGKGAVVAASAGALARAVGAVFDNPPDRSPAPQTAAYTVTAGVQSHLQALRSLIALRPSTLMTVEPAAEPAVA